MSQKETVEVIKKKAAPLLQKLANNRAARRLGKIPVGATTAMGEQLDALELGLRTLLDCMELPEDALNAHLKELEADSERRNVPARRNAPPRRASGCSGPYDNEPGDM